MLALIDPTVPNAFAVGKDPQNASVVVTRELLALLARRELEGVLGPELAGADHAG